MKFNCLLTALLVIVVTTCFSQTDKQMIMKETNKINDRSLQGHVEQDIEKILSAYAEDALLLPPGQKPISGLANIREFYQKGFNWGKTLRVETSNIEFLQIDDNNAIESGAYTIVAREKAATSDTLIEGYMMIYWTKIDDEWKIKTDMWH